MQCCVIYTPLLLVQRAHTSGKEFCLVGMLPSCSHNHSWALEICFTTQSHDRVFFLWALLTLVGSWHFSYCLFHSTASGDYEQMALECSHPLPCMFSGISKFVLLRPKKHKENWVKTKIKVCSHNAVPGGTLKWSMGTLRGLLWECNAAHHPELH